MSDLNSRHNRVVWCDIPVADLERASAFYRAVLATGVGRMTAAHSPAETTNARKRATSNGQSSSRPSSSSRSTGTRAP